MFLEAISKAVSDWSKWFVYAKLQQPTGQSYLIFYGQVL